MPRFLARLFGGRGGGSNSSSSADGITKQRKKKRGQRSLFGDKKKKQDDRSRSVAHTVAETTSVSTIHHCDFSSANVDVVAAPLLRRSTSSSSRNGREEDSQRRKSSSRRLLRGGGGGGRSSSSKQQQKEERSRSQRTASESCSISAIDFPLHTIGVPAAPPPLPLFQAAPSTKVRFVESKNQEYESPFAFEDLSDCCYSQEDKDRFQQESNATVAEMQRIQAKDPEAEPYERVMLATYLACVTYREDDDGGDNNNNSAGPLDGTELEELREWIRTCPRFLGLEGCAIASISRNRLFRAQRMRSTIQSFSLSEGFFSDEMRVELERISRPSSVFARLLAQVQASVNVIDDDCRSGDDSGDSGSDDETQEICFDQAQANVDAVDECSEALESDESQAATVDDNNEPQEDEANADFANDNCSSSDASQESTTNFEWAADDDDDYRRSEHKEMVEPTIDVVGDCRRSVTQEEEASFEQVVDDDDDSNRSEDQEIQFDDEQVDEDCSSSEGTIVFEWVRVRRHNE